MTEPEADPAVAAGRRPRSPSQTAGRPSARTATRTSARTATRTSARTATRTTEQARARRAAGRQAEQSELHEPEAHERKPHEPELFDRKPQKPEGAAPEDDPVPGAQELTTELPAYRDSDVEPRFDYGSGTAQRAAPEAPEGKRLQGSPAWLDARTAVRAFPESAPGSELFDIAPIEVTAKQPLLVRLLRLQHVRPTGWQRAAVGDLPILVAVLLVLGDLATAWTLLVLPLVVLALVKFHDIIESRLAPLPAMSAAGLPFGDLEPAG